MFRRIRRCVTAHDRTARLLYQGSRAHGTWQYLEVFRILMEREYVWNVAFFSFVLSLVNAGEEMMIADQCIMFR